MSIREELYRDSGSYEVTIFDIGTPSGANQLAHAIVEQRA